MWTQRWNRYEPDKKKKKKKKRDKVHAAWISFAGRIVAQLVGAVATVSLGVLMLHRYTAPDREPPTPDASVAYSAPAASPLLPGQHSLAVLPLENYSSEPGGDHLADSLTEALIADLSGLDRLHVISRTSSMQFKGQRRPLPEIARELGADWILEGSIVRAGNHVRITAQLIDAATDRHAWAARYDRPTDDLLAMQSDVARAVTAGVTHALPPAP